MTRLRQRRRDLGLTQGAVARSTGLSRQALSALEAGRAAPSLANALALARALGTSVEALFGGAPQDPANEAFSGVTPADGRVRWSRIDGQLVVRPAGPGEEIDALVRFESGVPRGLSPLAGAVDPERAVWIGGCDPALPLVARAMERIAPHLSVQAVAMTTSEARAALGAGQIHAASLHGSPRPEHGAGPDTVLPYASWREGFVLAGGVARADLGRGNLRWAVRPRGATARSVLERYAPPAAAVSSGMVVASHWAVAEAIRSGNADAGVAVEAAAAAFGLGFVALEEEEVEMVVHEAAPEVAHVLARALADARLWSRLAALAGYRRAGA